MDCPFLFKGWCRKFNGGCDTIKNCGFKKNPKKLKELKLKYAYL